MSDPSFSTANDDKRRKNNHANRCSTDFPVELVNTIWEGFWFATLKKAKACDNTNERRVLLGMLRMCEEDCEQP